jgi:SAM-dependent methyltransferase
MRAEQLTAEQRARWETVLDRLMAALPAPGCPIAIDGHASSATPRRCSPPHATTPARAGPRLLLADAQRLALADRSFRRGADPPPARPGCRLLLADAQRLALAYRSVDAVFAAGPIHHLPDPGAGLAELARVTRTGGRLVLFHPSGRVALAYRHGRTLRPDEPLAEQVLRVSTERAGWRLTTYDDPSHRFLAIAVRK